MEKQAIVELVMRTEPPIHLKHRPGFDITRWYVAKAVEVTTKVVIKDFLAYSNNFKDNKW